MKILIERRGEKDRNENREGCERVRETESKKRRVVSESGISRMVLRLIRPHSGSS